jgi:hypothetical protein
MRRFVIGTTLLAAAVAFGRQTECREPVPPGDAPSGPAQAVSANLQIMVGRAGVDRDTGFVEIFGEVRNDTGEWILTPRIDVDLLDARGESLGVKSVATAVAEDMGKGDALDSTYALRDFVPPGEVAPFHYIRDAKKIGGTYASHRLRASARAIPAAEAPVVVIEGFSHESDKHGTLLARGVIRNTGTVGCRSPEAIVAAYDAGGKLFKLESDEPEEYSQKVLGPGESVAFTVRIHASDGDALSTVRSFADCGRVD